ADLLGLAEGAPRHRPFTRRYSLERVFLVGSAGRLVLARDERSAVARRERAGDRESRGAVMRVLLTGAAGYVGRRLARGLENDFDLRLADLWVKENDSRWVRLDVMDPRSTAAVVQGVDAVVHLAVASGHEGDYEDIGFNQIRFDVNVK